MDYDIIVIGGGPAGSTLARLLSNDYKVAVIDAKDQTATSLKKPCGGLLSPDAQRSLSKFGLNLPKEILVTPQIFAVHTIDLTNNLQRHYQRFYLNLDRHKFDLWLLSLIPKWVDIFSGSFCKGITKQDQGYAVQYNKNGKIHQFTAKYIIGADGANSVVRKTFSTTPIRQYLSIQKNYKANGYTPSYICFFDNALTDCYGWINVKDDTIQLGAALPKKTAKQSFKTLEDYFINEGFPFSKSIKTEACLVNRPKSTGQISLGSNNIFLIGEAAGFISTSSLEGISLAMDSALALAEAFKATDNNVEKIYRKNCIKLKFKVFTKVIKTPFIYHPFLRKLIMKSGITSISMHQQ